jgi:hypothetical protein
MLGSKDHPQSQKLINRASIHQEDCDGQHISFAKRRSAKRIGMSEKQTPLVLTENDDSRVFQNYLDQSSSKDYKKIKKGKALIKVNVMGANDMTPKVKLGYHTPQIIPPQPGSPGTNVYGKALSTQSVGKEGLNALPKKFNFDDDYDGDRDSRQNFINKSMSRQSEFRNTSIGPHPDPTHQGLIGEDPD